MEETDEIQKGALYGYIFHFNHYREEWVAIPRDEYVDYWNGKCSNCISNKDLDSLIIQVYELSIEL
jgi:hypothetical protein